MIYIGIGIIVLLVIMGVYYVYTLYTKSKDVMSFKQSMELCDMPIVTFYIGDRKLNFVLDTGCIQSMLDADIIDKYKLNVSYIGKNFEVWGANGKCSIDKMGVLGLYYNNKKFEETFVCSSTIKHTFSWLKQNKGVTVHGLLGSNFFNTYKYILDFNKLEFKR
jgi:hypothetical protein